MDHIAIGLTLMGVGLLAVSAYFRLNQAKP
jgi:hypothetical protein